ncbi:MAG: S8 family peptidase [Salinibacter sp.]
MRNAIASTLLVVALVLAGCASSQPATTDAGEAPTPDTTQAGPETASDASAADTTQAPADTALADADVSSAPRDWFHSSRDDRNIPGLGTETAYETLLNDQRPRDTVTVAIIDSGVDIDHDDLEGEQWTNADEVPDNGEDDDDNGYVDDTRGWNFIGGPDGDDVDADTYELTRLYVDLRERFDGVDSASVSSDERDAYQRFQKIEQEFQKKRQQAQKQLQNVQKARDAVEFATDAMSEHLDTDSLSREAVESVSASGSDVQRARDILLYFYRQDLSPSEVLDYHDYLKRKVEYNYNPDFNPRSIVGDDYEDKTERIYGNSDVTGPDAEHGTHVAGIIGATRDNDLGVKGVARAVRLMSVRAVPNGDERDKDVANAIRYAVDNGADVINMSFGKGYSPHKEVVDAAVQHADSMGVLMIHAAGNDGADVDTTDNYPSRRYADGGEASLWIEVGASSWKGGKNLAAPFSNYGDETVDVFAPGQAIYSTKPDNTYGRSDGTSMAAPMVSGVAALLMAYYPDLSPHQVRDLILETAISYRNVTVARPGDEDERVPFGDLSRTGAIVNVPAALDRANEMSQFGPQSQ